MSYSIQGNYYKKKNKHNQNNIDKKKRIETFEQSQDLQNITYKKEDEHKYIWCVTDRDRLSVRKEEDDNNWTPITGGIKNVSSSGIGYIWAVADDDRVYKCNKNCIDGNFQLPDKDIRLKQVSSDEEYVWGLDANGYVHKAPNDGSVPFIKATQFKNISASEHGGFYGVSTNDEIYQCKHIPGNLKQIDADKNELWGIDQGNNIYKCLSPCQGNWKKLGSEFKYVSAAPGKKHVWAITTNNRVFKCKKPCNGNWQEVDGRIKDIG
jgi:hypothetical protein